MRAALLLLGACNWFGLESPVLAGDGSVVDGITTDAQLSGTLQISAGGKHTCVRLRTGAVRCWGSPESGCLGLGDLVQIGDNEIPASVGPVLVGGTVAQVSASAGSHTCAVLDTGAVRCWGAGTNGRLGYADIVDIGDDENETPATVGNIMLGMTAVEVTTGAAFSCARSAAGAVRCWGSGGSGQLGYGAGSDVGDNEHPATSGDINIGVAATSISAGGSHVCALLTTGNVRCWGSGANGRLGYSNLNSIGDTELPWSAGDVSIGGPVMMISAGLQHTCALRTNRAVRCWGNGANGQLGYANTFDIGDDETPATAGDIEIGGPALAIAAGTAHTCALLDAGDVVCWGLGGNGQLGYANSNSSGDNERPSSAGTVVLSGKAIAITAGGSHTCAILDTNAVQCWGHAAQGQLGYGNTMSIGDNETPASAGPVSFE